MGEGGGEAIRVGQVVLRLETGGQLAEFRVNVDDLNGKLGDLLELGGRRRARFQAPRESPPNLAGGAYMASLAICAGLRATIPACLANGIT